MGAALAAVVIGSVPAFAETLTVETFTGAAVSDPSAWVAGGDGLNFPGWPGKACLTGGSDTSQAPIPGCANPSIDPAGSGVLRGQHLDRWQPGLRAVPERAAHLRWSRHHVQPGAVGHLLGAR